MSVTICDAEELGDLAKRDCAPPPHTRITHKGRLGRVSRYQGWAPGFAVEFDDDPTALFLVRQGGQEPKPVSGEEYSRTIAALAYQAGSSGSAMRDSFARIYWHAFDAGLAEAFKAKEAHRLWLLENDPETIIRNLLNAIHAASLDREGWDACKRAEAWLANCAT